MQRQDSWRNGRGSQSTEPTFGVLVFRRQRVVDARKVDGERERGLTTLHAESRKDPNAIKTCIHDEERLHGTELIKL